MALTTNQIAVAMFGIAAGGFKAEVDAFLAANGEVATVAALLPASGLNPTFLGQEIYTNQQFAEALVNKMMPGLAATIATATASIIVNYMNANPALTRAEVVVALITALDDVPHTDPVFGVVAKSFDDKVALADAYTGTSTDFDELAQVIGNQPVENVGQTFTLTVGADNIAGTSGNDTINGAMDDNTAANNTFTVLDVIDGGAGTDTLNITVDASGAAVAFPAATVKNVELFNFRNVSGQTLTIDSTIFSGETEINSDRSTNQVDITGVASGVTVGIKGDGNTVNGTLNITTAAAVATAALAISGGTKGGAINLSDAADSVTALTIASSGAANEVGAIDLDADGGTNAVKTLTVNAATNLKTGNITNFAANSTINVAGAATKVELGTLENTNVTKLDASGMTAGGVTAVLNNVTTISVTGGTGNDKFTTGAVLTGTGKVDGGNGTDTLTIAASTHLTVDTGKLYTNFETLGVAAGVTVDLDHIAGITAVEVTDANASAVVVNDMTATQAANVTVKGYGGAATFAVKGAGDVGQLDTVKLIFDDGDTTLNESLKDANALTATLANIETLQIHAVDAAEITQSAAASGDLSKIELTGAGDITLVTGNISTINMIIDGSAGTGKQVIDASGYATNGVAIKVGTGSANTITGSLQADVFTLNSGKDTIMTLDGDTVNNFTGGTGGDIIDVSGTGNTSLGTVMVDTDGTAKVLAATSTGAVAWANNAVLFVSVAEAASLDTQAEIAALFGAGKTFEAPTAGEEVTLFIAAADTGKVYAYDLEESGVNTSFADAADTVTLVGTFNGVTAAQLDTWVAGNFQA